MRQCVKGVKPRVHWFLLVYAFDWDEGYGNGNMGWDVCMRQTEHPGEELKCRHGRLR